MNFNVFDKDYYGKELRKTDLLLPLDIVGDIVDFCTVGLQYLESLKEKERVIVKEVVIQRNSLIFANVCIIFNEVSENDIINSHPNYSLVLNKLFTTQMGSNQAVLLDFLGYYYPADWVSRYNAGFGEEGLAQLIAEVDCTGNAQDISIYNNSIE